MVAFSPLFDGRFVETLRDMSASLIMVDVLNAEPPAVAPSPTTPPARIWTLEQDAIRFSLRRSASRGSWPGTA